MLRFLSFSFSIILGVVFHSWLVLGAVLAIVIGVAWRQKHDWKEIGLLIASVFLASGAILHYDWRTSLPIFPHQEYRIIEQQRTTRYLIESPDQNKYFLYSRAKLIPGDIIYSSRYLQQRKFTPDRCILPCQDSSRQDRQVNDNESFDYDSWLYMQGIHGSLYDDNPQVIDKKPNKRTEIRNLITHKFDQLLASPKSQALGLGMILGDRSGFSQEHYDKFITSGLVHLVAVSGTHLAIVLAIVSLLLFWIPYRMRIPLLIISIIAYAYLVGVHSSIVRSSLMSILTLLVLLPGRKLSIRRILAYARTLMLVRNPYLVVYDLGFLLSFGALLGIIWADKLVFRRLIPYFLPYLDYRALENNKVISLQRLYQDSIRQEWMSHPRRRRSKERWKRGFIKLIRLTLLPSIGATFGIFPVLIYFTGEINILNPLANILVIPFVPLLMGGLVTLLVFPYYRLGEIISRMLEIVDILASIASHYAVTLQISRTGASILGVVWIAYRLWRIEQETRSQARYEIEPS